MTIEEFARQSSDGTVKSPDEGLYRELRKLSTLERGDMVIDLIGSIALDDPDIIPGLLTVLVAGSPLIMATARGLFDAG